MNAEDQAVETMRQLVASTGRGFSEEQARINVRQMGAEEAIDNLKLTIGFVREIKGTRTEGITQ